MSITWNANIPQPTDLVSTSQGQILQNNQAINSVFNDATNGVFTKYLVQNVGTIASLTDPVSAFHAINGSGTAGFSGHPVPYFKNSVGDYPLIPDITAVGSQGYWFQIGNLIVNFGQVSLAASGGNHALTFPKAFTTSYSATANSSNAIVAVGVSQTSLSVCNFVTESGAINPLVVNYIAIGY